MSRYNPYVISLAIEDFRFEITNWINRIREFIQDLRYEFRLVQESVRQLHAVVANVRSETDTDTAQVQELQQHVTESRTNLNARNQEISAWEKYITELSKNVQDHRNYWETELSAALTWVSDAYRILQVAEGRLTAARDKLYEAERSLEAALNYRDSEGKRQSTSYEERAVNEARREYNQAQSEYEQAQYEYNRAVARQNSCQAALNTIASAEEKLEAVHETLNHVWSSYNEADDSQSQAESSMSDAISTNKKEIAATQQAESNVAQASEQIDAGEVLLNQIYQDNQIAYTNANGATRMMDHRLEKLRMLDIPDLGS